MQHTASHINTTCPSRGFTLIELLVVLAILSLLMAIAYPHYTNIAQKIRRSDAQESLLFYQTKLSRCYLQTLDYTPCLANLDLENGKHITSLENQYSLIAIIDDHTLILEATALPESPQVQDSECQRFVLNQYGNMQAYRANGEENTLACWGM